jgi:hypothetical protein
MKAYLPSYTLSRTHARKKSHFRVLVGGGPNRKEY